MVAIGLRGIRMIHIRMRKTRECANLGVVGSSLGSSCVVVKHLGFLTALL